MIQVVQPALKPTYAYSSPPRLPWDKSNCKNETERQPRPYGNLVFKSRVIRGPAYVQHPTVAPGVESQAARDAEVRRRAMARRKAQRATILKLRFDSPPPGKRKAPSMAQTESYLEEVLDHPVESAAETQTELMLDRPQSPLYIPAQSGVDRSTQIQLDELFDFELEVEPILEIIVGKTLEQALAETMEEEDLESIRMQQRYFKEVRNAQLAEEHRLQEQATARRLEIEQRLIDHEEAVKTQLESRDRIAAAIVTTGYLESIIPDVVRNLNQSGQALDPIKKEIDNAFISWLMAEVKKEIQRILQADKCIVNIMNDIQRLREETARDEGSDVEEEPDNFSVMLMQEFVDEEEEIIPIVISDNDSFSETSLKLLPSTSILSQHFTWQSAIKRVK